MTAGRPIGNHIRTICALVEKMGPTTARMLMPHMQDMKQTNISKYCSRAVGLGLMTVKPGKARIGDSNAYTIVPGWEEMADKRKTTKLKPAKPRQPRTPAIQVIAHATSSHWHGVSSVFHISQ